MEAFAETDHAALREELVQVAAVALSWVEDIDRKAMARHREAMGPNGPLARDIAAGRLPLRSPGARP